MKIKILNNGYWEYLDFLIKEKENRKQSNPWKTNTTFSVKEKKGKEIELIKPFLKHARHKAHFTDF